MSWVTWAVAAVVTDDDGRVLLCRQGPGERRWALPGGRLRRPEHPVRAVVRDIRAETGLTVEVVDLVGLYHLTDPDRPTSGPAGRAAPPPDVLVHVFRARPDRAGPPAGERPRGCRLSWHDPAALPEALTPTARAAVADVLAGRSGVVRDGRVAAPPVAVTTGAVGSRATGAAARETTTPAPRGEPEAGRATRP